MKPLYTLIAGVALGVALFLSGCSTLSNFYNAPSSFPSAQTLLADCASGKAAVPPVRNNACDLYNAVSTFCAGQSLLPMNAVQACVLAGYSVTSANNQQLHQ